MKKIMLFLGCLFSVSLTNAAVSDGSDVQGIDRSVELVYSQKNDRNLSLNNDSISASANESDQFVRDAKARKLGGFLLTGVVVYQSMRVVGYATVFGAGAATIIAGAAGGPGGVSAAYLTVLATVPTAISTVESASLAVGTAASFIPMLP